MLAGLLVGLAGVSAVSLAQAADPAAVLIPIRGAVEVHPAKGHGGAAVLGQRLNRGDSVRVARGGSATLVFRDGTILELGEQSLAVVGGQLRHERGAEAPGVPSDVFVRASRFATAGSRQAGLTALLPMRGAGHGSPIIVAPRQTRLLSDRPAFAWRGVENATRYRVTVSDSSGPLWSREVVAAGLAYPDDARPLPRGAEVLWGVRAFSNLGELERDETVVHVLQKSEAAAVRADLERIRKAAGDGQEVEHYLAGTYLFDLKLYADAAGEFEALCRQMPESPDAHEALASVYGAIGLADRTTTELRRAQDLRR